MLRPRIIPCLLVHENGLYKTVEFASPKYVGDPVNAVRIFNEKEVDEIIVLDIDATAKNQEPDYKRVERLAVECRMPLCYGGGVRSAEQAQRIIQLGVEKVSISAAMVDNPALISEMASAVGSQSVVVVVDARRKADGSYEVWTHNGTRPTGRTPAEVARDAEAAGAGEVVINSIDRDGRMAGYDFDLVDTVRNVMNLQLTVLGGAGSLDDIAALIARYGIVGAAAGSLFVFKGPYRAVLINYPKPAEKRVLIDVAFERGPQS